MAVTTPFSMEVIFTFTCCHWLSQTVPGSTLIDLVMVLWSDGLVCKSGDGPVLQKQRPVRRGLP